MNKHKLNADSLKVEAFETISGPTAPGDTVADGGDCICFAPPCICTNGPDCTQA